MDSSYYKIENHQSSDYNIKHTLGVKGERMTLRYLESRGFCIILKNFRCRYGEIDIIAYDPADDALCFVEVKTRTSMRKGRPCEAVDYRKLSNLKRTAYYYLRGERPFCRRMRIDISEVMLFGKTKRINYMKNIG